MINQAIEAKLKEIVSEANTSLEGLGKRSRELYPEVRNMYDCGEGYYRNIARYAWAARAKKIVCAQIAAALEDLEQYQTVVWDINDPLDGKPNLKAYGRNGSFYQTGISIRARAYPVDNIVITGISSRGKESLSAQLKIPIQAVPDVIASLATIYNNHAKQNQVQNRGDNPK